VPEVRAAASVDRPISEIWPWIADMDNWAPMLRGYQSHTKESDTESIWTLTGELGPMSKTIELRVSIVEWKDGERVAFELTGIGEPVSGHGAFDLHEDAPPEPVAPPARSWWRRLLDWLRRVPPPLPAPPPKPCASHVVFTFAIEAGGPMGPMINAMLGPYAEAVANELLASVAESMGTEGAAP
jgi:carbon monoxide dehydrogenase subunit G